MRLKILILLLAIPLLIIAQSQKDKITLTTGEVYLGKIVFQNETMLVIRTDDGARFQFQQSQISKQELVDEATETPSETTEERYDSNFRLMPNIQIGVNNAKFKFASAISSEFSLAMGINNFSGKNWFLGGGVGLFNLFDPTSNDTENFLPIFVRTQANFGDKQSAMFWGIDAGYHFSLNPNYAGGIYSKISLGYSQKISERTNLNISLSGAIRNIETQLTETRNNINYVYTGNSNIVGLGLNIGLSF